jgi:hypothetical protein
MYLHVYIPIILNSLRAYCLKVRMIAHSVIPETQRAGRVQAE